MSRAAIALSGLQSLTAWEYYNDSKATTPHATLAALQSFEASVLIAGGRNKGLELGCASQCG